MNYPLGNHFVIGIFDTTLTDDLRSLLKHFHPGGIILFDHNIKDPLQLAQLCQSLQSFRKSINDPPLFISMDQEGGSVARLKPPFTQFPDNRKLGDTQSRQLVYDLASAMGQEMAAVGINLDFAPVVDVNTCKTNPIIGIRAYGDNPDVVSQMGTAAIEGLQHEGVIACAKHFPGHGDTQEDSHKTLPVLSHPIERVRQIDWTPFAAAIHAQVGMIMTAHILFPKIDPDFPATLSSKILSYLRGELHFSGPIITDDLYMRGITKNYSVEESCIRAFQAGCDLLLLCFPGEIQEKAMENFINNGENLLGATALAQSQQRIQKLRERFNISYFEMSPRKIKEIVGKPEHKKLAISIKPAS